MLRDQRWGDPLTASVASGIKVARVRSWLEHGTWEPVASMRREKPKWKPHKGQSTDARHRGGLARSSDEVPVMGMERRGQIIQFLRWVNRAIGRNPARRRGRWPGDKSRMRRESHVRFREGLGVKFPRATRLLQVLDEAARPEVNQGTAAGIFSGATDGRRAREPLLADGSDGRGTRWRHLGRGIRPLPGARGGGPRRRSPPGEWGQARARPPSRDRPPRPPRLARRLS